MKIYEYAVIHHPIATKEQQERGEKPRSEMVVDVTRVSDSYETAFSFATRSDPTPLDRVKSNFLAAEARQGMQQEA